MRLQALEDRLSSETEQIQAPNPYSGELETWDLIKSYTNLGQYFSIFHGVLAHEFFHAFGITHGGMCPLPETGDLMGSVYYRFGHSVSQMYNFSDNAYPFDRPVTSIHNLVPQLGEMYTHYIAHSPYLNPFTHPDKTDPVSSIFYPPHGSIWDGNLENSFHITAYDLSGGSGLDATYFLRGIDILDFHVFNNFFDVEPCNLTFFKNPGPLNLSIPAGLSQFNTITSDNAGNISHGQIGLFRIIKDSSVVDNTVYIAPASYTRIPTSQLGSYENPYTSIQIAIDTVAETGLGTVFILDGTYTITSSIILKSYVNLVGERLGNVILDGNGDDDLYIIRSDVDSNESGTNTISRITFTNAMIGIFGSSPTNTISIVNCLFYNMSECGIYLVNLCYNTNISQNTCINCNTGILLLLYYNPERIISPFVFRNNLVYHLSGTGYAGIQLYGMPIYESTSRCGWNLCYGFLNNFLGSGDYETERLEGEISGPVTFQMEHPLDFRLIPGSLGTKQGDPLTSNQDGSIRDIGAFIDTPSITRAKNWMNYE